MSLRNYYPEEILELRRKWEGGRDVIARFYVDDVFVVVTHGLRSFYCVFRYFTLGGRWVVSMDLTDGSADEAFETLDRVLGYLD